MKFFVPDVAEPDEAERFHAILKVIAAGRVGPLSARRIYSITFNRGRALQTATVGEIDTVSGLRCVMIFEAARGGLYSIFTEGPIGRNGQLVGPVLHVEAFDETE